MGKRTAGTVLILIIGLMLTAGRAFATQTDNHGLHAVPAPGKVVIDGTLDDWDLSGQTLMTYDIENLRDVYSAEVALMYDRNNLYVGIHWKDPKPMINHHDPHYQGDKGWAADSVQLRFKTDEVAHVTAWYYSDKQEPAININYGTDGAPFSGASVNLYHTQGWHLDRGAEMAFKKDPDGKGYVQEIRLPWNLVVKNKTYGPGDQFNMGVEILWGSTDWPDMRYADNLMPGKSSREFFFTAVNDWGPVTLEPKGHLHLPTPAYMLRALHPASEAPGPVAIAYTLPTDSRVTLVIDDKTGRRVRTLIPALPRPRGKNVDTWNGLDDDGKPAPPGSYQYRILIHDPIHVRYALSYANPGNPTWGTPDGRGSFYGDHSAPHAVAAGGDYVGLACPIGEAGQPLIGCDLNGQRLWGQANRVFGAFGIMTLATDGKILWVGSEGNPPVIYRVRIADGLYAPWNTTATDAQGQKYQVLDLPVSVKDDRPTDSAAQAGPNLTALAYRDGVLAVCLSRENTIKLLDSDTGAVERTLSVPAPQSVVLDTDGSLLALSRGKLLRLAADGSSAPFTARAYPDGYGLAMDAQRNVYLSVRGQDQNVKVFSPTGQPLREIGKRGGRPADGPYDPEGMRNPAQIAVDSRGRLWVTEENDNPKRTSVWDTQSGRLVKDLPGSTHYAAAGALDPYDPTRGFNDNTVYALDWDKGTYRPVYSLAKRDDPDDLFPPAVMNITNRVLRHGGDTYVYTNEGWTTISKWTLLRDGRWRSVAAVGMVLDPDALRRNQYAPKELAERFSSAVFHGHIGEAYAWADKNGDGLVQPDEITFAPIVADGKPVKLHSTGWGQMPGPDGTLIYYSPETQSLIKFPITGYTDVGAPIYDVAHPQIVKVDRPLVQDNEGMIAGGAGGVVYFNADPLFAVDKSGHVLWTYPSNVVGVHGSHNATAARPGYLIGPNSILGVADLGPQAGEVFDMNGNMGENYLFTRDGFLVQTLFKDLRAGYTTPERAIRGMPMDDITGGGESFGGNFVRTADGHVYLTIGGTDARVLEVTSLDTLRRLPTGHFTYTPREYVQAQRITLKNAARAAEPRIYTISRATTPPVIDGKADDWPELLNDSKPLMEIQDSPDRRYARVAARYDDRNLYLAWRVFTSHDHPINAGQDTRLLFKTGDAVDLMLGPSSTASRSGSTERDGLKAFAGTYEWAQGTGRITMESCPQDTCFVKRRASGAVKERPLNYLEYYICPQELCIDTPKGIPTRLWSDVMSYRAYPEPAPRPIGYDPVRDLPSNHLAWLIESTVEDALQNKTLPAQEGQPPFDPRLCAKVLLYGYATGIRSSRRLEQNCRENLPFLLLTRGDTPSYRTLCSFRVEHADIIEEIWVQLFVVSGQLGFKRLGRLVIDSSKFLADASAESVVSADEYEALRQELQAVLKEASDADQKEDQHSPGTTTLDKEVKPDQMREILRRVRKQLTANKKKTGAVLTNDPLAEADERARLGPGMIPRIEAALSTLEQAEQEERKHACLTDPDARMMGEGRDKPIKECHSFEVVVDKDAQLLVVGQTTQEGNDNSRLEPLIEAARAQEPEGIVSADADSGYYKGEVIARLQEQGIDTCVPDSLTAKRLRSEALAQNACSPPVCSEASVALRYDAERDIFLCAANRVLSVQSTRKQGGRDVKIYVSETECTGCPLASLCLRNSTSKHRTTSRAVDENNPVDVALARFSDADHQQRYHDRGMIVETVFAFVRHILGYDRWTLRGTQRVAAEGSLFKTAYQFRKVHCAWKLASAA